MKLKKPILATLAAVLTCTSDAAVVTFTEAFIDIPDFGPSGGDASGSTDGATTSLTEADLFIQPDNYQISAIAVAGQGVLKASVSETRSGSLTTTPIGGTLFAETWTGGSGVSSRVVSYASFTDSLTATAAGLAGQSGTAVFRFRVDGNTYSDFTTPTVGLPMELSADGASQNFNFDAGWNLYIGAVGEQELAFDNNVGEGYTGGYTDMTGLGGAGGGDTDGMYEFEVPFTYGESFEIEYTLLAYLSVTNLDPNGTIISEIGASFLNTAELEEIEFLDSGGTSVSGTSLTTGSGAAYNVIPEPSALLLSFLGLVPAMRRRR